MQEDPLQVKKELEEFLLEFKNFSELLTGGKGTKYEEIQEAASHLRRKEPRVSSLVVTIQGKKTIFMGYGPSSSNATVIHDVLMGGNNWMDHNFYGFRNAVISTLEAAIGAIEGGLWPKDDAITPVLDIHDNELKNRCSDLLNAPGHYDRVVREATTVLEDRIRNRVPHEKLAAIIPNAVDQAGENLVNKIFSPDNPILRISSDKSKCIALHRMLLATVSYLRNPYHHKLDDKTEWTWSWAVVGLVDHLLKDIESCTIS